MTRSCISGVKTACSVRANLRDGITKARPDDFPLFLYMNEQVDSEDLFRGFLRNMILVKVSDTRIFFNSKLSVSYDIQGYLHVFRGPSAATNSSRSGTRKGNAATHSITKVTVPSIAYIATLVRRDSYIFGRSGLTINSLIPFRSVLSSLINQRSALEGVLVTGPIAHSIAHFWRLSVS